MDSKLNLTIASGQVIAVTLSGYAEAQVLGMIAAQQEATRAAAEAEQAALMRTYHLGAKPTPGRGYDDRLKMRLGCGSDKARELVTTGVIACVNLGCRYSICEQAVRDFYNTTRKVTP
jgi:hypothetical protein